MKGSGDQQSSTGENVFHVPPVETHLIRSVNVAQTFKIQVMRPARRRNDSRRYPVVYVTDGNWVFDMFKSISYLLQMSPDDSPPFILVGIGYPSECPHAGRTLRSRDFLAPPYPKWGLEDRADYMRRNAVPEYEGVLLPERGTQESQGGEDFRNFMERELIPFVDDRFETIPGDRTYFGHSGGGYFGLFTMFTRPALFKNYIVSSPGVIYDGIAPGGIRYDNNEFGLQMVRDFARSGQSMDGIRLYLSAGADEEFEPVIANWRLTSSLQRLIKVFKNAAIPGLSLMTEIFPGETHITAWPIAFVHGVQAMLGTRNVSRSVYF